MLKKLYIFLVSLFLTCNLLSQEKYEISAEYHNLSFNDFVLKAEAGFHIKFYYKEEWVKDLRLGIYPSGTTLTGVLDNLLSGRSIFYFIDDAGNVILTKDFAIKAPDKAVTGEQNYILPSDYGDNRQDRQQSGNVILTIGNPADRNKPGSVAITGYITNRDSKEPVSGVTVFEQDLLLGAVSNENGFYSLALPRGSHLIKFSFIGMRERAINVYVNGPGEMNVEMNSVLIPLKETIISAQKNLVLQRFESGMEKINIPTFRLMPTTMGESDIITSVLLLPGVQSVGEGSAGFNVRGGSSDQNLILLYGAPVYNYSHFFGFFTAVNSDIIKDVTLYKGGIPGRYGGRISSVLDIGTKEGNRKEFAGSAGISPITTHLMVEGPIKKDTCTFILTGRTTYSNWILKLMDDPALQRSRAAFYDLNGKITYDINKNNKLDFSSYYSHDSFRFNTDTTYSYNNSIVALRWRHFFNGRFLSLFSLNNSHYNYDVTAIGNASEAFLLAHSINSTGFKSDFNLYQGRHELNFGLDMTRYSVSPGSYLPANDSSLIAPDIIQKEKALETAIYFEDKFSLTEYLSLNAGIRFSSYLTFGPHQILNYDPLQSKSISSVTDTLNFRAHEISKAYAGPEFRLSMNYKLTDKSSLKINYNRTRQYLHLLSNSTSISPTDTWKLSDYYIKPQVGDQIALGYYRMVNKNRIEASAEFYYKSIRDMIDYKGGTSLIMNRYIESDIANVKGKAYGMELMLRKTEGKLRWSAGYTYSRTFIKSTGKFSSEIINNGKWFPANFDKPHDLVLTFNYLYSRRFSFSANYIYSTGRPITYPVATYNIGDIVLIHYSERNKYRIPDYSRLDLSVRISGNLKSHRIAHPNWTFSVFNLLGRENVYSVYFENEGDVVNGYKLSIFGRAIPSVTFSFDF